MTCVSHQEFQQSVGPIDAVYDFIHVLHRSLTELLHHKENIDEQSAEDLEQGEKDVFIGAMLLKGRRLHFNLLLPAVRSGWTRR